jgi:hypothetical protein
MHIIRVLLFVVISAGLAGCGTQQRFQLAAAPLDPAPQTRPADQSMAVHLLVEQSQTNCAAFVNNLFATNAGTNVALDVAGTATSALATVFTATPVTHSLSAASTLFGATKTSISSEFLNTLTMSHIIEAIQSTYGTDIQKYLAYLQTADPTKIDYYAERDQIQSYHVECGLAAAEGSIANTIGPAPAVPAQPSTFTYTVPQASLSLATVTNNFITSFNISAFRTAGVTSSPTRTTGQVSFAMSAPLTLTVSFSGHVTASLSNSTPPILTISGTPAKGDTITITGTPAKQPTTVTTPPTPQGAAPAGPPAAPALLVAPAAVFGPMAPAPAPPPAGLSGRNTTLGASPPAR